MASDKVAPKEWVDRIKLGEKFREEYGDARAWARFWRYYRNRFGERQLPINLVFAMARSLVPRIYFRNPRVVVTPTKPGFYWHAKVLERVDNWLIREMRVKKALKKVALDTFLYGTGIVKLGFDSEYGFSLEDVSETGGLPSDDMDTENLTEYDVNIKPGMPWVKRIAPDTFVVPWGTEDLDDVPWVAHKIVRLLEDVKNDPRYENTKDLGGTLSHKPLPREERTLYDQDERSAADTYVALWEIHDVKRHRVYVVAENYDKYLRNVPDDLSIEGLPYEAVTFNPDSDFFWGVPDALIIEPQQLEMNHARKMQALHERFSLVKLLAQRGAIKDEELDKLVDPNADPLAVVFTEVRPNEAFAPFQAHIPPDYTLYIRELRQDVREQVGFSRNQMGEFDVSTRRTATEAAIVEQAASIRVDERRDALADMLENIIRKVNQMIFTFWSDDRVVDIAGPDGRVYWVQFTGEEIRGEYTYKIDPESSLPVSSQTRKQEARELYMALAQNQRVNQDALLRHLLNQYETIDPEVFLAPSPQVQGLGVESAVPLQQFIQTAMQVGGVPGAAL